MRVELMERKDWSLFVGEREVARLTQVGEVFACSLVLDRSENRGEVFEVEGDDAREVTRDVLSRLGYGSEEEEIKVEWAVLRGHPASPAPEVPEIDDREEWVDRDGNEGID